MSTKFGSTSKPADGTGYTSTNAVLVSANSWLQYPLVLISRVTVYVPGTSYTWLGLGEVDVLPSPNNHV